MTPRNDPPFTLIPQSEPIRLTPAIIEFPSYEQILENATRVANQVLTVEVTEDNTKESKKLLAAVRKEVQKLDRGRIDVKKEILKPYQELEQQVKHIISVVDEAEEHLDSQIKVLLEKEKEEKEVKVREVFRKRIKQYDFEELIAEDSFISRHYLNSSVSMNQVEKEMVAQLEKVHQEIETIQLMDNAEDILTEYVLHLDLTLAIKTVKEREERNKRVVEMVQQVNPNQEPVTVFVVKGKLQATLVEKLLIEHEITFEKR